jgi:energy-coupling factor transporter ATP-binding protein EcfA2
MKSRRRSFLRLLLDAPEEDAIFGFDEYASALTSAIFETDPHFTIGIFGKWGSGKTTLLKKIQHILESSYSEKVLAVFFDAWRYQREEHMLLPILDTLLENLKREDTHWRELSSKLKRLTASMATAMTLKLPFLEFHGKSALKQWQAQEQVRSDYFGWLSELQKALDGLRSADPDRRIVVLIDDLDRCLPSKVVEVLESIKVMLDVPGFVFVLALDELVVEQAIQSYYGQNYSVPSKDYIKKLVQVEFRLPPLRTQDVVNYVQILQRRIGQIGGKASQTLAQVVPIAVGDNPRDVKRFVNAVLLGTAVMRNIGITVPISQQIAFMAMEFRWPDVVRTLAGDKSLWDVVKLYVLAREEGGASLFSEQQAKIFEDVLEGKLDLVSYLENSPGKELLGLSDDALNELVYYTSITREKNKAEVAQELIDEVLNELTDQEKRILQLLLGILDGRPRTLQEIGKEFNVPGERINEISFKAIRKLRHPTRSRKLRDLLSSIDELDYSSQTLLTLIFGSD